MTNSYVDTVAAGERILSGTLGTGFDLTLTEAIVDYPGAAALVLRCRPDPMPNGWPESLVLKRSQSPTNHLFREWANLEFLNSQEPLDSLIPTFYGAEAETETMLLEDVSPGRELLGNIVEGNDATLAERGLHAFMRGIGRLHASTAGQDERWRRFPVRQSRHLTSRHIVHRPAETFAGLLDILAKQGVVVSPHLTREIDRFRDEILNPGPFNTFTHGDAAIGNVFYSGDDDVRLIDFETGAYRHALIDGSYPRMRYIQSIWARRMPLDLQRKLLETYRTVLSHSCPEASDDRRFNHGLLACSAFWMAAILTALPRLKDQDQKRGRSTERQRIVAALGHLVQLSEDLGVISPLAEAANELRHALRTRWTPDQCTMRLCNAFQSPPNQ